LKAGDPVDGYIKLYRKLLDNPIICKDSDYLAVWIYLLLNATHKEYPALFKGEKITLRPGQLITGRKSIADKLNISESKVQRILKSFENEHQIEQQPSNQNRLITIVNWQEYQSNEQQIEQPMNNERTTSEQRVNTNKNDKNDKNIYKDIVEYLNQKTGSKFKHTSKATQRHINGRLSEGFSLDDFKIVIDKKVIEWKDNPKMSQYLRPETLFGTKFEGYLYQKEVKGNPQSTPKLNPKIHNFPERQYTKDDYNSIEKALLRRSLDANKN
jgi:uncharacterized phage protein (TIGR02220 family)